jgi:hypothetical protein
MTIEFVPNDPAAGTPAARQIQKHADRAGGVDFTFDQLPPEQVYRAGTIEFVQWQSREAALRTLDVWEDIAAPIAEWGPEGSGVTALPLQAAVASAALEATYSRSDGLSFFQTPVNGNPFFSGASTDVVAHETGHALLDAIRPDLWSTGYFETDAFHEAFADCMALLVALYDQQTRVDLLAATANLGAQNFVEAWGEDLAQAVAVNHGANNTFAVPRRAFNNFKWQFHETLGWTGQNVLLNEVHIFGQVFTGCFYDLIRGIYGTGQKGEAGLLQAAKDAGQLLAAGAKKAPHVPRFLQSVGRTMSLEEETLFQGKYRQVLRDAFAAHNVPLGASSMVAPRAEIGDETAIQADAHASAIGAPARAELRKHLRMEAGARLQIRQLELGGMRMLEAHHRRKIDLSSVAEYLKGVHAFGHEPVLLRRAAGKAAILGSVPDAVTTEKEVLSYVRMLAQHQQIRQGRVSGADKMGKPTHEIAASGAQRVLRRLRYSCGCAT